MNIVKCFMLFLGLVEGLKISNKFDLCIVGASSGLGKELVYQGINEKKLDILALTSKNYITEPYRGNSFNEKETIVPIKNEKLFIQNYWSYVNSDYSNIIFCTGAKPFEKDYSDKLTEKFLSNLPDSCKSITLISAYGVGDSLYNSNLGIKIMDKLYLKDVYRAKNKQENLVNGINKIDSNVNYTKIYRPKALSYGETFLDSTSRQSLAEEILEDLF